MPGAYFPTPQLPHVVASLAPGVTEKRPAVQPLHTAALEPPATVEYVPAGQLTQIAALVAATASEKVPLTQPVHVAAELAPSAAEYVPPAQLAHWLIGAYTAQVHCAWSLLPVFRSTAPESASATETTRPAGPPVL